MDARLHCVYLLTSLDPACRDAFYIGYTTNPLRRLRQHNGELTSGAWTTKRRGRPWTLVCFVSGFPEDRVGLKFEWCWQHPFRATMIREALAAAGDDGGAAGGVLSQASSTGDQRSRRGAAAAVVPRRSDVTAITSLRKIYQAVAVLHILLRCPLFQQLGLRLNIVDPVRFDGYCAAMPKARHPLLAPLPLPQHQEHDANREPQLLLTVAVVSEAELVDWMSSASRMGAAASSSLLDVGAQPPSYHHNHTASSDLQVREDSEPLRCRSATDGGMSYSAAAEGSSQLNLSQATALTTITSAANSNISAIHATRVQQLVREGLACDMAAQKAGVLFCTLCSLPLEHVDRVMYCQREGGAPQACALRAHIACLALWCFYHPRGVLGPPHPPPQQQQQAANSGQSHRGGDANTQSGEANAASPFIPTTLIPSSSALCPLCDHVLWWGIAVQQLKQRSVWIKHTLTAARQTRLDEALRERLRAIESCGISAEARRSRHRQQKKAPGNTSHVIAADLPPMTHASSQPGTNKRGRSECVEAWPSRSGASAQSSTIPALSAAPKAAAVAGCVPPPPLPTSAGGWRCDSGTLTALNPGDDDEEEPLILDAVQNGVLAAPSSGIRTAQNDDLDWWMDLRDP